MAVSEISSAATERQETSLFPRGNFLPFFLVTALFFLWGVPNNLNDVLIRQFMKSFEINRFQAGLIQSAFYAGYFVLAIPAGLIMRRLGYKAGFIIGLILFGTGAFMFWPAAVFGRYVFFLFALFVIASGLSFLETASNPFIAQCGAPETSERRLNFSQAFNPVGAISGVLVGTVFIFSGIELSPQEIAGMREVGTYAPYLQHEILRVVRPYVVLGLIALVWAVFVALTKFPAVHGETKFVRKTPMRASRLLRFVHFILAVVRQFADLLRYPHFILAVIAQFLYVGAQVGTWSYFIQYVQDYTHRPERTAGYFLTGTLIAFGVGRFASSYMMKFIAPNKLMGLYALINVALLFVGVFFPGSAGLWAIFLTSFFMSLMFPTIFALGLKGLGDNTKIAGSLLVMAIIGGAVLTPLMGFISLRTQSLAPAYLVPLFAYVFITYYGFFGSHVRGTAA
jgi:MFS transporter, FHS family, L-fucose permease